MRELSIFIDESGDFGPFEKHSPFQILGLVFHDQSDDITGHLDKIHDGLVARGLPVDHAVTPALSFGVNRSTGGWIWRLAVRSSLCSSTSCTSAR